MRPARKDERDPETGRWLTWKGTLPPLPRSEWPEDTPNFDAFSWYMNRQHPAEVAAGWVKAQPEKPRCGSPSWSRHWMGNDLCPVPDHELYPEDWNDGRYLPVTLDAHGHVIDPRGSGSHDEPSQLAKGANRKPGATSISSTEPGAIATRVGRR